MNAPILTLWDIMERFDLPSLCELFSILSRSIQLASTQSVTLPGSEISTHWIERMRMEILMPTTIYAAQLDLPESVAFAGRLSGEWTSPVRCEELRWGLHHLSEVMQNEIKKHLFFYISESLVPYYQQKTPFGEEISKAFPSACLDITEAGTSLACGCNSAAAFHLMRAAEVGLWELGRDRQIPLAQSNKIEFAEWGQIIRELEEAIKAIQQWSNSSTKEDAHKFYNYVLEEVRSFNDGWRRHLAHLRKTQKPLEADEAMALSGHVSRFLEKLASKIAEGRYTSLVW